MSNSNNDQKIEEAISAHKDIPSQIDAIAIIRGWFRPKESSKYYPYLQAYLSGTVSLSETIPAITANIGQKGFEEPDSLDFAYSILHSAKRISFRNKADHMKLVEIIQTVKGKDPDWNRLFGMATREVWNDAPGAQAGYYQPEYQAWANVNYFIALLTKLSLFEDWIYAVWAMRPALEVTPEGEGNVKASTKVDASLPAAAVWVFALGKDLYAKEVDLTPKEKGHGNPGIGGELWKKEGGKAEFSKTRWAFWKKRFGELSQFEGIQQETKKIAQEAVKEMEQSEKA